jgi:hypothetical protein
MQIDFVDERAVETTGAKTVAAGSSDFISMVLSQPDSAEKVQLLRELIGASAGP